MKRAALGFRMHSGWGVLVAVSSDNNSVEVLIRKRIVVIDPKFPGAKQPYHYVMNRPLPAAEKHIADCAAVSERLAIAVIEEVVQELKAIKYCVVGAAVLLASGRPLPELSKILAAHPLIHTAEGEFFRNVVRKASEKLKLPVTAIRERDLDERAKMIYGTSASRMQRRIETMGTFIGPPWTKDHKSAALAAAMILVQRAGHQAEAGLRRS